MKLSSRCGLCLWVSLGTPLETIWFQAHACDGRLVFSWATARQVASLLTAGWVSVRFLQSGYFLLAIHNTVADQSQQESEKEEQSTPTWKPQPFHIQDWKVTSHHLLIFQSLETSHWTYPAIKGRGIFQGLGRQWSHRRGPNPGTTLQCACENPKNLHNLQSYTHESAL